MKQKVNIRLEPETIRWLKSKGKISDVIREAILRYKTQTPIPTVFPRSFPKCERRMMACDKKRREVTIEQCLKCIEREP